MNLLFAILIVYSSGSPNAIAASKVLTNCVTVRFIEPNGFISSTIVLGPAKVLPTTDAVAPGTTEMLAPTGCGALFVEAADMIVSFLVLGPARVLPTTDVIAPGTTEVFGSTEMI
ncbi:hypothetical protein Bhyg_11876 [Pseudolycoriella hygida]|uniref:Secreted protein n=1 Tax=Pseudolycoriella hygida TaxID=35572 RepID=A0A9Q0S0C2_9DIPT|nr:hypothetical protein Bhyg_11876 [Pseudolycoriella hygida]